MTCHQEDTWTLMSMNLLEPSQVSERNDHLLDCPGCRERFNRARREHAVLMRMYESLDRNHDELRDQLLASLPQGAAGPASTGRAAGGWRRLGDYVMSLNSTKGRRAAAVLVVAASVLIAVTMFLSSGQGSAFAAAIEHLRRAEVIVCGVTTTIHIEIQPRPNAESTEGESSKRQGPHETAMTIHEKLYMSPDLGVRRDTFEGEALIRTMYSSQGEPTIMLDRVDQTYVRFVGDDEATPEEFKKAAAAHGVPAINFMSLPSDPDRLIEGLRNLTEEADRVLGHEVIEGRDAIGFEIAGEKVGFGPPWTSQSNDNRAELWADSETGVPLRLVFHYAQHVSATAGMPGDVSYKMTTVYDRFEWDTALRTDWFKAVIPDGYVLRDDFAPQTIEAPDEAALLAALRQFSDLTDRYPTSLNIADVGSEVAVLAGLMRARQLAAKRAGREEAPGPDMNSLNKLSGLAYFALLEMQGREPKYFGDGVKPGDADKVLMQWQLEKGGTRVIHGDLRVETLPSEE